MITNMQTIDYEVFWHFKAWALNPGTFLAWSSLGRSTAFVKLPSWRWLGIEGALISIPEELLEMTESDNGICTFESTWINAGANLWGFLMT